MSSMKTKIYEYTVIFEPNETGGYTITVPTLPGLISEGKDLADAQVMAREAIRCHLESLAMDGQELPEEGELAQMRLSVKIPAHA